MLLLFAAAHTQTDSIFKSDLKFIIVKSAYRHAELLLGIIGK